MKKNAMLLTAIIAAILLFSISYYYNIPQECTTRECLLSGIENCKPTTYTEAVDILVIENTVNRDCEIRRVVTDFTAPVPPEIKDKYLGKEYICRFDKGEYETQALQEDTIICI